MNIEARIIALEGRRRARVEYAASADNGNEVAERIFSTVYAVLRERGAGPEEIAEVRIHELRVLGEGSEVCRAEANPADLAVLDGLTDADLAAARERTKGESALVYVRRALDLPPDWPKRDRSGQ